MRETDSVAGVSPQTAQLLPIPPDRIDHAAIDRAAAVIRQGGLVAFPTETVYGLGCNALDDDAVQRVFAAKGRPADDPIIVHVLEDWPLSRVMTPGSGARTIGVLMDGFWPGPLTIVGDRAPGIPDSVTGGLSTVAVRCPAHPVARALLRAAGVPIAAPSANRFSYVSPTSAEHVLADLGDRCDIVIDSGRTDHGIESTVVTIDGDDIIVLRHGAVTNEELIRAVADQGLRVAELPSHHDRSGTSPGMLARHYSPSSRTLAVTPGLPYLRPPLETLTASHVFYLGYEDRLPKLPPDWQFVSLGRLDDLAGIAFNLYDTLRQLDAPATDDVLLVELTAVLGLGRAIDDRITRAAAGQILTATGKLTAVLRAR